MKVLTIATHHNADLERLLVSARKFNIEVELVGEGREYVDHSVKTDWLLERLADFDDDEIVLYTDGYDSAFLRGLGYIEEEFLKIGHPMVFGVEQNFNVEDTFLRKLMYYINYPKGKKPYRFLNAGGWIGRAGYASKLLKLVVGGDDQSLLLKHVSRNHDAIAHDSQQRIFSCMAGRSGVEDHDYEKGEDGLIRNKVTNSKPAIIHCAGKNFYGMYKVTSQLNYFPEESFTEEDIKQYKRNRFWNTLTAYTTADNYLFHLLLKVFVLVIALGLIALTIF